MKKDIARLCELYEIMDRAKAATAIGIRAYALHVKLDSPFYERSTLGNTIKELQDIYTRANREFDWIIGVEVRVKKDELLKSNDHRLRR